MTVTSPSASKQTDFGLFGNPESRRSEGFSIALGSRCRQRPRLVPWERVLRGNDWESLLEPMPRFLRLDSPGRNWTVERLLLQHGAEVVDEEAKRGWRRLSGDAAPRFEPGRVLPMRQWFLGWRRTLQLLASWSARRTVASRWLNSPADVVCMFDKLASHEALVHRGIDVPALLGVPDNFEHLRAMMELQRIWRVFIKPCHGSSASGVIALEQSAHQVQAFTTVQLEDAPDGLRLYNHRQIRLYRGPAEVRRLVDAICAERCIVQQWVPKAGLDGKPFDVRVVVIAGRARHVMVRLGNGPITNSQLLGGKLEPHRLQDRMGRGAWTNLMELCERVMRECFPRSLYAGIDVAILPDFRSEKILEVNAFGDLLPRVLHDGKETYECEIDAAFASEYAFASEASGQVLDKSWHLDRTEHATR